MQHASKRPSPRRRVPRAWRAAGAIALAGALPTVAAELSEAEIKQRVEALDPGLAVESVAASAAPGLYEVEVQGGDYLYVTSDGRHLLAGNLYELREDGLVGITEARRQGKRRQLVAAVPDSDMLVFTPADGAKASVAVFTDTDCGYCRRMHTSLPEYHVLGIELRYLAYPRAGVGSATYDDMVSAWCAEDRLAALTALKRGEDIPAKQCINPVAEQHALGQEVGITGTPSILLPDGQLLPGLVAADQLAELLGI